MPKLGVLSNLWVNVSAENNPSWIALNLISDCTVTPNWDQGEASSRQSRAKLFEPTMVDLEISGKVRVNGGFLNQAYNAFDASFTGEIPIDILALNGAINEIGSDGFRFYAKVFNLGEDQSLGVVLYKDFSVKPCIPPAPNTFGAPVGGGSFPRRARVNGAGAIVYSLMGNGVG